MAIAFAFHIHTPAVCRNAVGESRPEVRWSGLCPPVAAPILIAFTKQFDQLRYINFARHLPREQTLYALVGFSSSRSRGARFRLWLEDLRR
jgi:hypothetical protein